MTEPITVLMTKEEGALFVLFQKHFDSVAYMISEGVFDIKLGSATLNFDSDGFLLSIEKRAVKHRKKHPPLFTNVKDVV